MQQTDVFNKIYKCLNGEKVTFTFIATGTASRIHWMLQGSNDLNPVQNDTFTTEGIAEETVVIIIFDFINESGTGGSYDVSLQGDKGGGKFHDVPSTDQNCDALLPGSYLFRLQSA